MEPINIKNWHFSRWILVLAGSFFGAQAFYYVEAIPALLGAFLLYQAITGNGCLVYGSCGVSMQQKKDEGGRNIEYTKIEEN